MRHLIVVMESGIRGLRAWLSAGVLSQRGGPVAHAYRGKTLRVIFMRAIIGDMRRSVLGRTNGKLGMVLYIVI